VRRLTPELRRDLEELVRIPSVSVPGELGEPLLAAFEMTSRLFADAGVEVGRLDLPDTAPVVVGKIPPPAGAPTVLLYSHYDVVSAGDESQWKSPPFEPTERDGALFGRGRSPRCQAGSQRPAYVSSRVLPTTMSSATPGLAGSMTPSLLGRRRTKSAPYQLDGSDERGDRIAAAQRGARPRSAGPARPLHIRNFKKPCLLRHEGRRRRPARTSGRGCVWARRGVRGSVRGGCLRGCSRAHARVKDSLAESDGWRPGAARGCNDRGHTWGVRGFGHACESPCTCAVWSSGSPAVSLAGLWQGSGWIAFM
jgi:hypothetical protein